MSFSLSNQDFDLVEPVGRRLAEEVRKMSAKEAARVLGTSLPTIGRMRAGEVPSASILLRAIKAFGASILEPVTGPLDADYQLSRLDRVEVLLSEIRNGVSRSTAAAGSSLEGVGTVHRRDGGRLSGGVGRALDELSGQHVLPLAAPGAGSVALVQQRRNLDFLSSRDGEALRRHLNVLDKVVSLDHVRSVMQADNRHKTGFAYRRPGEDWTINPAGENRLWTPSNNPRRATEFEGDVDALRRDLNEAAQSRQPIIVTHAGGFVRDGKMLTFNSSVIRLGGRSVCGAEVVLTDFVRSAA